MNRSRIALICSIACASAACGAQEAVARIGVVAPLTGSIAHLGKDMADGAILAVEDLNAKGLVIGGRRVRFEVVEEDDAADPRTATQVAQKLADMKVNGVVGHLNSGTTIPAANIYDAAGIPQVAPAATNPKYTQAGHKWAVRLMATDLQQGSGIATFAATSLHATTAAIVDDRTAYGQGLADQVAVDLAKAGVKVLKREYTSAQSSDFTAILTSLRGADPDVVVFAGADAQAGPMARQMKALGLGARFIGGDGICTGEWSTLAAGANEGFYCSQAGARQDAMADFGRFAQRFKARFGSDVVVFAPYGYDSVKVIAAAMASAGSIDPSVYGRFVPKAEIDGLTGKIRFDERGDNLNGVVTIYQVRGGKLEPVR